MRLDKVLANMGFGTRKEVKKAVKDKEVYVNGVLAKDPGMKVDPENDEIRIWDMEVDYQEHIYLMLNKADGYVSSTDDPEYPTVLDLIDPYYYTFKPHPVGRLDIDTTGLLLLTNDGVLSHKLTSPKREVMKWYEAEVEGEVSEKEVQAFKEGLEIRMEGYRAKPAELEIVESGDLSFVRVGITEGKYHQVKHMFREVGMRVLSLKRIAMGPLVLDEDLEEGDYRELTQEEIDLLKEV